MENMNPKDALGIAKNPHCCVPLTVLAELGVAMMEGARKYGRHNYRCTDIRASIYYDAARRHLDAWWEGEDIDPDSGLHHLVKAIASLTVCRDGEIQDKLYDDRPPKTPSEFYKHLAEITKGVIEKYPNEVGPYINKKKEPTLKDTLSTKFYCPGCDEKIRLYKDGDILVLCEICSNREENSA